MTLDLVLAGPVPAAVSPDLLKRAVALVGQEVKPKVPIETEGGIINLKLVDDRQIEALNKKYSGQAKATDVLSFSYIEDGAVPVGNELGDVAISLETAGRQAAEAGTNLETELALLLIHGALHILGFDHDQTSEQAEMDRLQQQLMAKLKLTYRDFQWTS